MRPFIESELSQMRVSLYDGFQFPEHLHTQLEMIYLFSGSAEMIVDSKCVRLSPGDLAVSFPNTVHGYRSTKSPAQGLMMIIAPEYCSDFKQQLLNTKPEQALVPKSLLRSDVAQVARAIASEYITGNDDAVQRAYIQVILARVMPVLTLRPNTSSGEGEEELLRRAMIYLSTHWLEAVTLNDLARELGVSKYHLSRQFSERLHTNFRTYVNSLRVERAQQLLRGTNASVTDICFDCGFESQRTFNRAFFQLTGAAPRQYRQYAEKS